MNRDIEPRPMTRPRSADDFDAIRHRQRELATENGRPATGANCICPPGPLVIPACPVHNVEFQNILGSSFSACDCPVDYDVLGVYRKTHVQGCLSHVWSLAEAAAYRRWQAERGQ